ncbi:hypothetical protein EDB86DRAFT_2877699 [Lactarius hatsudake]|nr:hypothetical protein EDB86DRAFT_2877699 [Lactarius hatsudake]
MPLTLLGLPCPLPLAYTPSLLWCRCRCTDFPAVGITDGTPTARCLCAVSTPALALPDLAACHLYPGPHQCYSFLGRLFASSRSSVLAYAVSPSCVPLHFLPAPRPRSGAAVSARIFLPSVHRHCAVSAIGALSARCLCVVTCPP